jgi:preprotein translocase subunit SecE
MKKKPTQKAKGKGRSRQRKLSTDPSLSATADTAESLVKEGVVAKATSPAQKRTVPPKKEKSGNGISSIFHKTGQFLREAKTELKKVKWPTRKELLASTAVVIVLTLLVALFLGLVDFGLIKIIKNII